MGFSKDLFPLDSSGLSQARCRALPEERWLERAWLPGTLLRGFGLSAVFDFQALSNVPPLRNYFLEEDNYKNIKRPPGDIMFLLVQRFGELMRKLWNPRNFKAHVSPHEMLQAVVLCSRKTFQITKQGKEQGLGVALWHSTCLEFMRP